MQKKKTNNLEALNDKDAGNIISLMSGLMFDKPTGVINDILRITALTAFQNLRRNEDKTDGEVIVHMVNHIEYSLRQFADDLYGAD